MIDVEGYWSEGAEPLKEAFTENFRRFGETGAALAVVRGGEVIASLWAGTRDREQTLPWREDTCVNVFSAGKPLVAAVIMTLVAEGALDLDKPIGVYWPAFAARGKEAITARQILSHTSGLSAFHPRVKEPVIFDRVAVASLLEYETPWWSPGTAQGYSPFLCGWILAELACRVSGETDFNRVFQQRVAQPLAMQAYYGVPIDQQQALADVAPLKKPLGSIGIASEGANSAALGQLMKADPRGVTNRAFSNPMSLMNSTNTQTWRSACIPAANCHTDALSLARFYADLASTQPSVVTREVRDQFTAGSAAQQDRVLGVNLRFGLGFMLSQDVDDCRYGSLAGFGHPGAGGSVGFADPESGIGFGYVTSRLGQSLLVDARAQSLIAALTCLEGG